MGEKNGSFTRNSSEKWFTMVKEVEWLPSPSFLSSSGGGFCCCESFVL